MLVKFEILRNSPLGRLGRIHTTHGTVDTPEFIFCATKGSVKGLAPWTLEQIGAQIILSNTYHIAVYPGEQQIASLGGVHGLSGWNGPMLTDSGGFQVFCLGGHGSVSDEIKNRKLVSAKGPLSTKSTVLSITEEGVLFKSYRDGSEIALTPEGSLALQIAMGADLIVNFDECTPCHITYQQTAEALARTNRWQSRGLAYFTQHGSSTQGLYGVVQGGVHEDLRTQSMQYCNQQDFFGYAVGGSLGKDLHDMHHVLKVFERHKEPERPVHLLGMGGKVREIFEALPYGIDTFDCVHPTRIARHGFAICPYYISPRGALNLYNQHYAQDVRPLDHRCTCMTCQYFTRAALHTLIRAGEFTGLAALIEHNVTTMVRLMREIRAGIAEDRLEEVRRVWIGR